MSAGMSMSDKTPRAGGALIAIAILVGAVVGIAWRQASLGVVVGLAAGIGLALLVWLADKRR
jgi:UDP-N-acetylmuramyl pentapeptide phosphotransferase/UDP-N-acetylglucosamine-1-phosphate transferase